MTGQTPQRLAPARRWRWIVHGLEPVHARARQLRAVMAVATLLAVLAPLAIAHAQSGWPSWPWSNPEPRRELPSPPPGPPGGYYPQREGRPLPPGQRPLTVDGMTARERFCYQLEQRLVQTTTQGNQARDQLPKIEQEARQIDRAYQQARSRLENSNCFEYFLFSKTLRRDRQCIDLNRQVEDMRQRLADLEAQRQSITGSRGARGMQDEIIQELGRNGCGANYQQEAARRERQGGFGFPWMTDDEEGGSGGGMRQQGALPFSTYRTVCVRLCDGYFFPVSFSTMQSQFPKDAQVCSSKCAAPTELFYYQNPGGEIEQATSISGAPYMKLPNALRHRKEVVQGCSCKQAEYQPELLGQKGLRKAEPATPLPPAQPGTTAAAASIGAAQSVPPPTATIGSPAAVIGAPVKRAQPKAAAPAPEDQIAQTIERTRPARPPQAELPQPTTR